MNQPITQLLRRLWRHINPRRRGQFVLLLILMTLASFAEILSIGAILPFLAVLTEPARVFVHPTAQPFIEALGLTEPKQLLLPLTIAFCLAALVAGVMRLILLWASTRLSFATGADLSIRIYHRTLYQPYSVQVARNSSSVIDAIAAKAFAVVTSAISPFLNLINSTFVLVAILAALLSVDATVALATFGGFGLIYVLVMRITRQTALVNSQSTARNSTQVIKSLQEGLGGIRDILIDGSQATFCRIYQSAAYPLHRAHGASVFITSSPRFAVETLGIILIAAIAYSLSVSNDGIAQAIPSRGAFVIGAQRLLPILQQAYAAVSNMRGGQAALQETLELLDQQLPEYADKPAPEPLPFLKQLKLKDISFCYSPQTPHVLKKFSLTVAKGSRIGFIGSTGSGKSTLLDILMGLLQPTEGTLEIDGLTVSATNHRAWQAHIAHVPQFIFLSDSPIAENIAFGVPAHQIDHARVRQAARQALIADTIETWPEKYQTYVGERGVRLSGGQRQRIGIARALYKQADVIILDEATSALDNQTEHDVMQSIKGLNEDITIFIVSHRLTTLKDCTQIVELGNGSILRTGNYQYIVGQANLT